MSSNLEKWAARVGGRGEDPELAAFKRDVDEARAALVMIEYGLTDELDKRHLRDAWDALTRLRARAERMASDDLRPALAESIRRMPHGSACACDKCAPFGVTK